jgi:thiamine pyrophosphate-dependent acetolactate synthase large subunit-like protein
MDMERQRALAVIFEQIQPDDIVLTTTGLISRESFVLDDRPGTFYMIGSMGLLSSIGLGLALLKPDRRVYLLEGDGSTLMGLGTLPMIGFEMPGNLLHFVLDNEAYDSTGGQPSITTEVDLTSIAGAAGYTYHTTVRNEEALREAIYDVRANDGPALVLAKTDQSSGHYSGPRVSHTPEEIRDRFMGAVNGPDNAG